MSQEFGLSQGSLGSHRSGSDGEEEQMGRRHSAAHHNAAALLLDDEDALEFERHVERHARGATVTYDDDQRMDLLKAHAMPQTQHSTQTHLQTPPGSPSPARRRGGLRSAKHTANNSPTTNAAGESNSTSPQVVPPVSLTTRRVNAAPMGTSPLLRAPPPPPKQWKTALLQMAQQANEAIVPQVARPPAHVFASPAITAASPIQAHTPGHPQPYAIASPAVTAHVHAAPITTTSMVSPIIQVLQPVGSPLPTAVAPSHSSPAMAFPPLQPSPHIIAPPQGSPHVGLLSQSQLESDEHVPGASTLGYGQPRRVSALDMINRPADFQQSQQQSRLSPAAIESHHRSSRSDKSHRHSSSAGGSSSRHRSTSSKDRHRSTNGDADRSKTTHTSSRDKTDKDKHRHRDDKGGHSHHKRKHSKDATSADHKAPRTHSTTAPAAVRVKQEPRATGGESTASTSSLLFPSTDEEFFAPISAPLADALQRHPTNSARPQRTTLQRPREVSLRDRALDYSKRQPRLSHTLDASLDAEEKANAMDETATIGEFAEMGQSGEGRAPKAELSLKMRTPERKQRLSHQFGLPDEDDEPRYGSGDRPYSSGRRGRKSQGALAQQLAVALRTDEFNAKRILSAEFNLSAHSIGQSAAPVASDSIVVRVLSCEQHFGSRLALVSLATAPVRPKYEYTRDQSLLSPMPVLTSHTAEVARYVARITPNAMFSSVPPSLLRMVLFPAEDYPSGTAGPTTFPKLSDFPDCFLRIRNPFGSFASERSIPLLVNILSWERIQGVEELARVCAEEGRVWKSEGERCKKFEQRAKQEEAELLAAESMARQSAGASGSANMFDVDENALLSPSMPRAVDMAAGELTLPRAPIRAVANLPKQADRVLPLDASLFGEKYAAYHPRGLEAGQFLDFMAEWREEQLPLASVRQHTNPSEHMISGLVQKVNWRGVNLRPTEEQLRASHVDPDETPPSFFIQDDTGAIVEVEVPVDLAPQWYDVFCIGPGGWVSMVYLEQSIRRATIRSDDASLQGLHRSLLPPKLQAECVKPWIVLTVTEESVFQLSLYSQLLAELKRAKKEEGEVGDLSIPCLRTEPLTALLQVAQVTTQAAVLPLSRIHLTGKIVHLNNHHPTGWQLFLADESLRIDNLDPSVAVTPPTPTMVVLITQTAHRRLLDTFFFVGDCIHLKDVCVEFDEVNQLPVLRADDYTELVRPVWRADDDTQPEKPYRLQAAARRVHPQSMQLVMIAQQKQRPVVTDDHRSSLVRILQQDHIATPLVQKHAVFGVVGNIQNAPEKPSVTACCSRCQTVLSTVFATFPLIPKFNGTAPFVCQHCGFVNVVDNNATGWLHLATVAVAIDDLPGRSFQLQIEAAELQELFLGASEETKNQAFRSNGQFHKFMLGRRLNVTCVFSPSSLRASPLDLRLPSSAVTFQVTTRVAQATADLYSSASQLESQSSSQYSQFGDTQPEQVQMARTVHLL